MVNKGLEVSDPKHPKHLVTWPYICECLRSPTVERNDVATKIEEGNYFVCFIETLITIFLHAHDW